MIAKRWLVMCVLLAGLGWTRAAHATGTVTSTAPLIDIGTVTTGQGASASSTLSTTDTTDTIAAFNLSGAANCATVFSITAPAVPATITSADSPLQTLTATVVHAPRGALTCTVTMVDGSGGALGAFQVKVTGDGPQIAVSPSPSFDYGQVRVTAGTGSPKSQNFTVTNGGDQSLTISSVAFSASGVLPGSGDFSLTSTLVAIPAGGNLALVVQFAPGAVGTRTAIMTINSNDAVTPAVAITLTGTGTSPIIKADTFDFGVVSDGVTTSNTAVTVENAGNGTLTIASATITSSTWITFGTNGASACGGASTCTFSGGLTATSASPAHPTLKCAIPAGTADGQQTATITYTSDTDTPGTQVASTTVTCTAGRPIVASNASPPLAFSDTVVNSTSTAQTFMLSNTGNVADTVTFNTPAGFNVSCSATPCTMAATTGSVTITVSFTPTGTGSFNNTLTFTDTNALFDDSTISVALTAKGIAPHATVTPTSLTFTALPVSTMSGSQIITLKNDGTSPLMVTNAAFTSGGTNYGTVGTVATVGAQMTSVAVGASLVWTLQCDPQAEGAANGNFRITSNSFADSSIVDVTLTCTGQAAIFNPASGTLTFGTVRIGNSATRSFTLMNSGNQDFTSITYAFTGGTGYSVDPTAPVPTSLAQGVTATATNIIFKPMVDTDGGAGTLTITGTWGSTHTTTAVFSLSGTAQDAGYSVTPTPLVFADQRFDQSTTQILTITNTGSAADGPVTITGMQIIPGSAITGDFTFTPAFTSNITLAAQATMQITVKCAPQDHIGNLTATFQTMSDLPTNPTRMVPLSVNSTTAILGVSPPTSTLDFGGLDVQAAASAQTITLTNSGSAAIGVTGTVITNTGGAFTIDDALLSGTIAAGSALAIPVTFKPPMEASYSATVVFNLTGLYMGNSMFPGNASGLLTETVTITGSGLDRHISTPDTVTFPDTFRNPGTAAPTMPITVTNTGGAILHVTAAMVDDNPVWTLTGGGPTGSPIDIGAGSSATLQVTFTPNTIGMQQTADLVITNDTTLTPMATVHLVGNSVARDVNVVPGTIDLGVTGVGVPASLSDHGELIDLMSMDPTNTYQVREIDITGDDGFTVDQSPTNVALLPQQKLEYDLTFTPTVAGTFSAMISVYLDQDPVPQTTLTVTAQAVAIDIHGGGGCNAGGGGDANGGAVIVLGAVGAIGLLGRRRRGAAVAAAAIALGLGVATTAHAEPTRNLDLSDFNPTPATITDTFELQSPDVGASGDWALGAVYSYATNPLSIDGGGMVDSPIKVRSMIELGGAYAFMRRFEVAVRVPLFDQSGDMPQFSGVNPPSGTAIGDLTLSGKVQLVRASAVALGIAAALELPTASSNEFAGVSDPTGRVIALGTWSRGRLVIDANLGAVLRAKSQLAGIEQGSGLIWGGGLSFRALDKLWLSAEIFGELDLGVTAMKAVSPVEGMLGAHYRVERRVTVGLAVGRGLVDGIGAPDVRGVFSMSFVPGSSDLAPIHLPPPPVIDGDRDGDGIPDSIDKCPDQPEDKDMFDDADGCPDPDNDGDGIPDVVDKCPLDPEDKDGFQDADGCPDKDNDNDGIPDAVDKCPNQPEDKDGFQDLDGCPDPDNDGDGIPDVIDKCPNEPETINGFQDEDGCPDKGDSLVVVSPDRLELLDAVQFSGNTAKISKASFNVLGQIAATLRAHVEIVRLRITAHVQPRDPAKDQDLSDRRAAAIRDWLVQWGIQTERLEPRGFGGSKPLVDPAQKGASGINDRIEMIILERK